MLSKNVMLDPSLFMERQIGPAVEREGAVDKLGRKTRKLSFLEFHIPETFEKVIFDDNMERAWDSIKEFFGTHGDFPERDILQHKLRNSIRYSTFSLGARPEDGEGGLQQDIQELNEGRYTDERDRILAELDLDTGDKRVVAQILVEELAFGLEMSPIFSRLKKTFNKMSAASQSVVTLSENYAMNTADRIIDWLESELPGYQRELTPVEALEIACKYKKMDAQIEAHKLALYREALKQEIPLTNWIAAPSGLYLSYAYNQSGAFSGNLLSDAPALISGGFTLILLDP